MVGGRTVSPRTPGDGADNLRQRRPPPSETGGRKQKGLAAPIILSPTNRTAYVSHVLNSRLASSAGMAAIGGQVQQSQRRLAPGKILSNPSPPSLLLQQVLFKYVPMKGMNEEMPKIAACQVLCWLTTRTRETRLQIKERER